MKRIIIVFLILPVSVFVSAQDVPFEIPTTNSHASIHQKVAATDIEVSYNRPSVKGRTIFGALVPYGEIWRTGSDASTKISFSTDVFINEMPLAAGSYEVFSIPEKDSWTLIFQQNKGQWGSYAYNKDNDVLRVQALSEKLNNSSETFSISFDHVTANATSMVLAWEKTKVSVSILIDLKSTVVPQLEASLKADGPKSYFRAAMFYFENKLDINRAAELMELALNENPGHIGMLYRYALILEEKGDREAAIEASQQSLSGAEKVPSQELKEEYTKLNNQLLKRLKN